MWFNFFVFFVFKKQSVKIDYILSSWHTGEISKFATLTEWFSTLFTTIKCMDLEWCEFLNAQRVKLVANEWFSTLFTTRKCMDLKWCEFSNAQLVKPVANCFLNNCYKAQPERLWEWCEFLNAQSVKFVPNCFFLSTLFTINGMASE